MIGLVHQQQWWPKQHPLLLVVAQTLQIGQEHSNKHCYVSALVLMDHNMVFSFKECQEKSDDNKQRHYSSIAGCFDCHAEKWVQSRLHSSYAACPGLHWKPQNAVIG
jgi:hypothetical protein